MDCLKDQVKLTPLQRFQFQVNPNNTSLVFKPSMYAGHSKSLKA